MDQHVAPVAHRCSYAQIDRSVEEARARFDPDEAEEIRAQAAEHRHVAIRLNDVTTDGLVYIEATTDLADALAFEAQVAAKAHDLLADHPDLPLDVRRSMALGHLGDGDDGGVSPGAGDPHPPRHDLPRRAGPGRQHQVLDHHRTTRRVVHHAGTRVTIRPVLDLNEHLYTDRYKPTAWLKEQVIQTHPTCVFPHCERPSRCCDLDHIIEWPEGPTDSLNLAPCAEATTATRPTAAGPTNASATTTSTGTAPTA